MDPSEGHQPAALREHAKGQDTQKYEHPDPFIFGAGNPTLRVSTYMLECSCVHSETISMLS